MTPPVRISPKYLRLLASLMEETGMEYSEVESFGDWLNEFKDRLNATAYLLSKREVEWSTVYAGLLREEIRLVSKDERRRVNSWEFGSPVNEP